MKYLSLLLLIAVSILCNNCNKENINPSKLGSIVVVNVVAGGESVKLNSYSVAVGNNSSSYYGLFSGIQDLYLWPVSDSLHPYFNYQKGLDVTLGDIYTLYLSGYPSSPDAMIIKEQLPVHTDSSTGIRFVNLSPNAPPLNVTLSTSPTVNEVANLGYKQVTEHKSYSALSNSSYTFQIRNAINNNVLTTFSLSASTIPRFANITLVIRGLVGNIGVTRVNNDR